MERTLHRRGSLAQHRDDIEMTVLIVNGVQLQRPLKFKRIASDGSSTLPYGYTQRLQHMQRLAHRLL